MPSLAAKQEKCLEWTVDGGTLLFPVLIAAEYGLPSVLARLLSARADPNEVASPKARDPDVHVYRRSAPLHAVLYDRFGDLFPCRAGVECVQLLLQHKANPEQMDCWGRRPVDLLLVTRRMAEARRDCPYVDATGIERACEEIATMFGAGAVDLLRQDARIPHKAMPCHCCLQEVPQDDYHVCQGCFEKLRVVWCSSCSDWKQLLQEETAKACACAQCSIIRQRQLYFCKAHASAKKQHEVSDQLICAGASDYRQLYLCEARAAAK